MRKKNKNILIGVSLILLVGFLIFIFNIPQTFTSQIEYTTVNRIATNNLADRFTATLKWTQDPYERDVTTCSYPKNWTITDSKNFAKPRSQSYLPPASTNLRVGEWFPADINGLESSLIALTIQPYTNRGASTSFIVKETSAECKVNRISQISGGNKLESITCRWIAEVYSDDACKITMKGYPTLTVNILKEGVECIDNSYCSEGNICNENNICVEEQDTVISKPPTEEKPIFTQVLNRIQEWISNIFNNLFGIKQTIIGESKVKPGSTQNYQISLSTTIPDSDFSDGTYQKQHANWALVDKDNNIIKQGSWEEISGEYNKDITITIPQELNNYVLLGIINQYDYEYDFNTNEWIKVSDEVVEKEAFNLKTRLPVPETQAPTLAKLQNIINSVWSWVKGLFRF